MEDIKVPLELLSNLLSIGILVALLIKYSQYKKKLTVLKNLLELKEQKKLSFEDKKFIQSNYNDYKMILAMDEQKLKLAYPIFILIIGILFAFLPFKEALIHLNVVVVAYIYLQISKIHTNNFLKLLTKLEKN